MFNHWIYVLLYAFTIYTVKIEQTSFTSSLCTSFFSLSVYTFYSLDNNKKNFKYEIDMIFKLKHSNEWNWQLNELSRDKNKTKTIQIEKSCNSHWIIPWYIRNYSMAVFAYGYIIIINDKYHSSILYYYSITIKFSSRIIICSWQDFLPKTFMKILVEGVRGSVSPKYRQFFVKSPKYRHFLREIPTRTYFF